MHCTVCTFFWFHFSLALFNDFFHAFLVIHLKNKKRNNKKKIKTKTESNLGTYTSYWEKKLRFLSHMWLWLMLQLLAPFLPQMCLFLTKGTSPHRSTAWESKKRLIWCQVCLHKRDYELLVCRYSCTNWAMEPCLPWEGETCKGWVRSIERGRSHCCCNKVGHVPFWSRLVPAIASDTA